MFRRLGLLKVKSVFLLKVVFLKATTLKQLREGLLAQMCIFFNSKNTECHLVSYKNAAFSIL